MVLILHIYIARTPRNQLFQRNSWRTGRTRGWQASQSNENLPWVAKWEVSRHHGGAEILEKILRFAGKVVDAVEDSAYLNTEKNVEEVATDLFGEETETKLFAENLSK